MAFVRHESSYRHNAKPAYDWFLFIPLGRPSSAEGYAQIQDPAWQDYKKETGGLFKSRSDMEDALDFIGWYNNKSNKLLGISKWDPKQLYLAYHEGHTGYKRGTYRNKPDLIGIADRVDFTARWENFCVPSKKTGNRKTRPKTISTASPSVSPQSPVPNRGKLCNRDR